MKAHGIHQTQTPIRDVPISSRKPKDETSSTSAKKRKLEQFEDGSNTAVDDDEVGFSSSSKIKDEGIITIKDEIDFSGYGTDWLTFSDSGAKTEFDPTLLHDGLSLEDCFQVEGFGAVDDQVLYDDGIPKEGGGHGDGGMRMMSDDQSGCHESITILD
ncbi:MAG: hypothetical protein MMC33_003828 [Icmadophila ericetorum]|nr:hypothetical protein [Icmadophila ericetorum]